MQTELSMKKPVEWIHLVFQSLLVALSIGAVFWTFSTNQQKTKDAIEEINKRLDKNDQQRHEDAILQRADMSELKIEYKELNQQMIQMRVLIEDKQNRKN